MSWYLKVLKKYAVFSGRARRKEYWYFALFNFIIGFVLSLPQILLPLLAPSLSPLPFLPLLLGFSVLSFVYSLAVLIPSIAVTVRRLHDTGRSGWWIFIGLIPFVGVIILFVYMVLDSQAGTNQYGPSPKLVEE
jgi:uncharacterized membrane protein YhaH (DUF805 family)